MPVSSVVSLSLCRVKPKTEICNCCFSVKHEVFRCKSKYWLALNQDNVSKWSDMSTCRLLFQWASTIKIQLSVMVKYKSDIIIINSLNDICSRHDIAERLLIWRFNNNHSSLRVKVLHFSCFLVKINCELEWWQQNIFRKGVNIH